MDHILVLSIMIKNEESSICKTLQPFVEAGVTNFLIYDTGSTDNTVNVAKKYCENNKVNYYVIEEPFINFCESRNRGIELTKQYFPNVLFFIMIDCEWYAEGIIHLIEFCVRNASSTADYYHIDLHSGAMVFSHSRLMRIKGNAYFKGKVHEYVNGIYGGKVSEHFYIKWLPNDAGIKKSAERFKRDLVLLLEEYDETHEPRSVFYLAQTYESLDDINNALKFYKERGEMVNGFDEEKFMALYRVGNIYNNMGNYEKATKYYLKAYKDRPTRAEPLVELACMNSDNRIKYMYAHLACKIPLPNDILFVQKDLYDYTRWDQLGIAAWYVGEFEEQLKALKVCLDTDIHKTHLRNNLKFCLDSLGKPKRPKILNLILYSPGYESMYEVLTKYLKELNIDHYFYMYSNKYDDEFVIEDNIIYIKGEESYIPGITNKTLDVFKYASENFKYDYIIRTNSSSVINYELLLFWLSYNDVDYTGPYNYSGSFVDLKSGLTEDKHKLYGTIPFIGGCCIILSNRAIKVLVSNMIFIKELNIIDDVVIGICLNKFFPKLIKLNINSLYTNHNNPSFNKNVLLYRFRNDEDRIIDVSGMKLITKTLLPHKITLEDNFTNAVCIPSNINEHVPILYKYALECNSVFEIGIRSTIAMSGFLYGLKKGSKYIATILNNFKDFNLIETLTKENKIDFKTIDKNCLSIELEELGEMDIIFVDGFHTYVHITYELEKFHGLCKKYIIFHNSSPPWENLNDNEYYGDYSEFPKSISRLKYGVWPAITDFLEKHNEEWVLKERLTNNHGLTVLERIKDMESLD